MNKNFLLYLDMFNIDVNDEIKKISDFIESNVDCDLIVESNIWFAFEWFYKLLKNDITLDEFFSYWDIYKSKFNYSNWIGFSIIFSIYEKITNWLLSNTIIILDESYKTYLLSKIWINDYEKFNEIALKNFVNIFYI